MINFTNVEELNKILRNTLITQSELSSERVLNSLSNYGTELDKLLSSDDYGSIDPNDTTLLFELVDRLASSDVSYKIDINNTEKIIYDKAYKLKIIIYGSSSSTLAIKLAGRLRSEEVRTYLYSQGVYLDTVSEPTILNEYMNNMMWLRNDLDVDIAVQFSITPVSVDSNFASLTELKTIQQ